MARKPASAAARKRSRYGRVGNRIDRLAANCLMACLRSGGVGGSGAGCRARRVGLSWASGLESRPSSVTPRTGPGAGRAPRAGSGRGHRLGEVVEEASGQSTVRGVLRLPGTTSTMASGPVGADDLPEVEHL